VTGDAAPETLSWRHTIAPTLALFTSAGTLVCCALPALLVTLGLGASLAGLVTAVPQIVWIATYKTWVFAGSGFMIALAALLQWRAQSLPCPADPAAARACARLRSASLWLTALAAGLWAIGFFFAFLAADLFFGPRG